MKEELPLDISSTKKVAPEIYDNLVCAPAFILASFVLFQVISSQLTAKSAKQTTKQESLVIIEQSRHRFDGF